MVDNHFVQMRGFHNLYDENGKCWGFQFCMRTKYYKGIWLSQFRTGNVIVDGVVYPKDTYMEHPGYGLHGRRDVFPH